MVTTKPIDAGALNTSLGELSSDSQKYINIYTRCFSRVS